MRSVAVEHLHQAQRNMGEALPLLKAGYPLSGAFEVSHVTSLAGRADGAGVPLRGG